MLAKADPRIVLLTGDLGFAVLDDYVKTLPGQFLNVGVAEQNMAALATGMAA
jgi:transketolase